MTLADGDGALYIIICATVSVNVVWLPPRIVGRGVVLVDGGLLFHRSFEFDRWHLMFVPNVVFWLFGVPRALYLVT